MMMKLNRFRLRGHRPGSDHSQYAPMKDFEVDRRSENIGASTNSNAHFDLTNYSAAQPDQDVMRAAPSATVRHARVRYLPLNRQGFRAARRELRGRSPLPSDQLRRSFDHSIERKRHAEYGGDRERQGDRVR